MNIFLQHLNYFSEGRHDPESEEHRLKLLDVDHSNISKDKDHDHYEDKIHNAIKGLNSDVHGKDTVKKYLEKFHASPNRWVRLGVAKHPEIHNHPELLDRLKNDSSHAIASVVGGSASKVKVSKPSNTSSSNSHTDSSIHPDGKYEAEVGSDSDIKGADKVTHLYHVSQDGKKSKVGYVVSKGNEHAAFAGEKPINHKFKPKSHKESLIQLINNHRGYR